MGRTSVLSAVAVRQVPGIRVSRERQSGLLRTMPMSGNTVNWAVRKKRDCREKVHQTQQKVESRQESRQNVAILSGLARQAVQLPRQPPNRATKLGLTMSYGHIINLAKEMTHRPDLFFNDEAIGNGNDVQLARALESLKPCIGSETIEHIIVRFPKLTPDVRIRVVASVLASDFCGLGKRRTLNTIIELAEENPFVSHIRYSYFMKRGYKDLPHNIEGNAIVFELRDYTEEHGWQFVRWIMVMKMWKDDKLDFRQDMQATKLGQRGFDELFKSCEDPYLLDWIHGVKEQAEKSLARFASRTSRR